LRRSEQVGAVRENKTRRDFAVYGERGLAARFAERGVMEIRVNGETRQWDRSVTVRDFLEALGIRPGAVVVERNLQIVPRERVAEEMVEDGDSIEIIRLVGGG
jgi:sulfur carrier protein